MLDLETLLQDGSINISLLLTRRCNFECEHCFYECSPKRYGGWISNEVLDAVHDQVLRLQRLNWWDYNVYPRINLIGGEPTLNFEEFERVLECVSRWDVEIEMTTNGWWLHRDKTARKFFETVAPYVDSDGSGLDSGFSVRISNDGFHDCFRPNWLQGEKLNHALAGLWEYSDREIFYKYKYVCTECWREFKQSPDYDECPCGGNVEIEDELAIPRVPPQPNPDDPWIYVQQYSTGSNLVIPAGRASSWGGNDKGGRHNCASGLSYLPNGQLMDICCSGSWLEVGAVYDDPVLLLAMAHQFVKEVKPSCYDCRERAVEWKQERGKEVRAQLETEIARELE